jgi:hypothetical protein
LEVIVAALRREQEGGPEVSYAVGLDLLVHEGFLQVFSFSFSTLIGFCDLMCSLRLFREGGLPQLLWLDQVSHFSPPCALRCGLLLIGPAPDW